MLSDLIRWSDDRGPLRGYFPESLDEERAGGWGDGSYVEPHSPMVPPPLSARNAVGHSLAMTCITVSKESP